MITQPNTPSRTPTTPNVRRRRWAAALLLGLMLNACTRPDEPVDIGIREVASDIVLGRQGGAPAPIVAPPPLPPTAVVIDVPVAPPPPAPPRFAPSPRPSGTASASPTPREPCPADAPLVAPRHDPRRDEATPPVEEALIYRNRGAFSVSGANANDGTFSGDSQRTVAAVDVQANGDFTYDVAAELSGTTTTTTYQVLNQAPVGDPGGVFGQGNVQDGRGLFLVRVVTQGPDGATARFQPAAPLLLLPFPNAPGMTFEDRGVDPLSGTTMDYAGTVGDIRRVNACGEPLHGIEVSLTGTISGPSTDVDFTATYVFATQYGGISIEDDFTTAGTEGSVTSSRTNHATVNGAPQHREAS